MKNWVIVWVMTLVECVASPGKVVCEKMAPFQVSFLISVDCSVVLDIFVQQYMHFSNILLLETPSCKAAPKLLSAINYNDNQQAPSRPDAELMVNRFSSEKEARD